MKLKNAQLIYTNSSFCHKNTPPLILVRELLESLQQVSWLGFILKLRLPIFQQWHLQFNQLHSGGTATEFNRFPF